jgi:proteasome lid subunit RPN8/RPN11
MRTITVVFKSRHLRKEIRGHIPEGAGLNTRLAIIEVEVNDILHRQIAMNKRYSLQFLPPEVTPAQTGAVQLQSLLTTDNYRLLDSRRRPVQAHPAFLAQIVLVPQQAASSSSELDARLADQITIYDTEHVVPGPIPTDDLPVDLPQIGRNLPITIRVSVPALEKARRHAASSMRREVGGICVGQVHHTSPNYVVDLIDTFEAQYTDNRQTSLTFTTDTWRAAQRTLDESYAAGGQSMVGWYHTHPGFGIFLSSHDLFIHQHFFTQPWHIALVIDPIRGEEGFFVWNDARQARVVRYPSDSVYVLNPSGYRAALAGNHTADHPPLSPLDDVADPTLQSDGRTQQPFSPPHQDEQPT